MKHLLRLSLTLLLSAAPSLLYCDTITLSGNPSALTINSAVAGSQPASVTNSSTTYSVSTTLTVRVITGKINTNMASGLTLQLGLAAPSGATSLGSVSMTTVAKNLITGIPINTTSSGNTVTYTFSATVSAVQASNQTKTLTLTLQ